MTIKPIPGFTAEMRDACVNVADARSMDEPLSPWDDGWNGACEYIAAAIRAMPVVPMFPEPLRVKPDSGTEVWCAHPAFSDFAMPITWMGSNGDLVWFERGLCHTAFEDAATHGWYLASLSAKTEDAA